MKYLSKRAESYLSKLKKDKEYCCDRETVIRYLENNCLPLIKPMVRFQTNYSGVDLTIRNLKHEDFFLRLFSNDDIDEGTEIRYIEYNGLRLFDCGYHLTAQYNFYIDENGRILVEIADDYYLELYSCAELMIEIYALLDSFDSDFFGATAYYFIRELDDLLLSLLYSGFSEIKDCCDNRNHLLKNGSLIVYCKPYWDYGNKMGLIVYGKDKIQCKELIDKLTKDGLIYTLN